MRSQKHYSFKQQIEQRAKTAMDALHADGWIPFWQEQSKRMAPRTGRFLQDRRQPSGIIRHNTILDNCAVDAANTLAAGFISGACSPARPWWRSTTTDPDLARYQPVREWFDEVDAVLRSILGASNFYRQSFDDFRQMSVFGQASGLLLRDDAKVLHLYPMALGEYAWATNEKDDVDTCFRRLALTTSQMVEKFGWEKVSDRVQEAWNMGRMDHWHTVWHAIVPRRDIEPGKGARSMPWGSYWWEDCESKGREAFLHESGFNRFPVIAPRWSAETGEVYGIGPGAFAFGDAGQLQHEQLRKGQVIDFGTAPPTQGPPGLSNDEINFLPGGLTIVDQPGTQPIKPIWQPVVPLSDLREDIQDVRQRINRAYFVDMFLMLANANDVQRTAREIAERSEERLLQVGPVVARVNNDKLEPTLRMVFETAMEMGRLPPPPEELDGQEWRIEFTSIFAQAQKLIGVNVVDRMIGTFRAIADMEPRVARKLNVNETIDFYQDAIGAPARMIVPTEKVLELERAENEAMAAKEQSAMVAEQAGAIQKLASAPTGQGNALDLVAQLRGLSTPTAEAI